MKSYIVDRSGLTPQLNEMPTNVEKIYPTIADAEAALANGDIADGEFVSTVDTVADTGDKFDKSYLSYSTEETLTGGTWIDGKPIYRKVITGLGDTYDNWSQVLLDASVSVDHIIYCDMVSNTRTGVSSNAAASASALTTIYADGTVHVRNNVSHTDANKVVYIAEYTKQ